MDFEQLLARKIDGLLSDGSMERAWYITINKLIVSAYLMCMLATLLMHTIIPTHLKLYIFN